MARIITVLILVCAGCTFHGAGVPDSCGYIEVEDSPFQAHEDSCSLFTSGGLMFTRGLESPSCEEPRDTCIRVEAGEWVRVWGTLGDSFGQRDVVRQRIECSEQCP